MVWFPCIGRGQRIKTRLHIFFTYHTHTQPGRLLGRQKPPPARPQIPLCDIHITTDYVIYDLLSLQIGVTLTKAHTRSNVMVLLNSSYLAGFFITGRVTYGLILLRDEIRP